MVVWFLVPSVEVVGWMMHHVPEERQRTWARSRVNGAEGRKFFKAIGG